MRKIKKVMLINPPNIISKDSIKRICEPIGLLYIAAVLIKRKYDVHIFDSILEGYGNVENINNTHILHGSRIEDIKKAILNYNPDVIGITCPFTQKESKFFEICSLVRQIIPTCTIVCGGIHPSFFPSRFLKTGLIDYVVLGEGDFRFADLLDSLNGLNDFNNLDGIGFKDKKGNIKIIKEQSKIQNLDTIPLPARNIIKMKKYIDICTPFAPFPQKSRVAQILTSRGCPYNCIFCSSINFWGRKFRARSVNNIMLEINELVTKYGIQEIQFLDDNLTLDRNRAIELFHRMIPYKLKWCTPNGLSVNTLDANMLGLMAKSGAYQITLGIESGSKYVLDKIINKKIDLDKIPKLVKAAHDNNILVHALFIVGFPGETKEQIQRTFDFAKKIDVDSVSFFVATPLPGSRLYKYCLEKRYINEDIYRFSDFKTGIINIPTDSTDYNYSPEELARLTDKKTREFNEEYKNRYPKKWAQKFSIFIEKNNRDARLIIGRVT